MQVVDGIAVFLLVAAAAAFASGGVALARAHDVEALYWLAVGAVGVQAAVQFGRPGAR
jgi:hypothetical protein